MEQLLNLNFNLANSLVNILNKIILNGATPILVGGIVRDYFLEKESKDYDIEIYGFKTIDELIFILKEFGEVNIVGVSFGILKLTVDNYDIDFSFPRIENKNGIGHRGFEILIDGNLTFEKASKRRDFTINSIGYDFKNKNFLDPFNGIEDIEKRVLKHIDDNTFIEDPLRVYRAIQFCARFDFVLDNNTKKLCRKMINSDDFKTLSKHRIFQEYKKLLLKSDKPSIGLKLLNEFKLINYESDILNNIDKMVKYKRENDKDSLVLMFYFLFDILETISDDKKLIKSIKSIKKLKVPKIYNYKVKDINCESKLVSVKFDIFRDMPIPFVEGKDLIKLGFKPSVEFKIILDKVYQMQLDGEVASKDEAISFIN